MIVRQAVDRAAFNPSKMGKATLLAGDQLFAGLNTFLPGQEHALHSHKGQDKLYFVLEGSGDITVGDRTERADPGDLVMACAGEPHAISNPGPGNLVVLTVMAPPPGQKAAPPGQA